MSIGRYVMPCLRKGEIEHKRGFCQEGSYASSDVVPSFNCFGFGQGVATGAAPNSCGGGNMNTYYSGNCSSGTSDSADFTKCYSCGAGGDITNNPQYCSGGAGRTPITWSSCNSTGTLPVG